jgi:hypothetical protein
MPLLLAACSRDPFCRSLAHSFMEASMRAFTIVRVLVYCCVAVPAGAQVTFANLRTAALPTVYVTDVAGQQTSGQLISVSDSALVIRTAAITQTFEPNQVSRLERKGDSLKNGTLIGLAVGVIGSGLMTGACLRAHCGGVAIPYALVNTGIYTAVGAAIDAAISGRTRLWDRSEKKTP